MSLRSLILLMVGASAALFSFNTSLQASPGAAEPAVIGGVTFPKRDAVGIAVDPASGRVFVSVSNESYCPYPGIAGNLYAVDEGTLVVTSSLETGSSCGALMAINSALGRAYVASMSGLDVIDTSSNTVVARITRDLSGNNIGFWGSDIAVNPNTNRVYFSGHAWFSVIDGQTNTVIAQPGGPPYFTSHRLAVNTVTNRIYAIDADGRLLVADGADNSAIAWVDIGHPTGYGGVAVNEQTNRVYVGHLQGVTVIDGATNAIIADVSLAGEGQSRRLAVNSAANRVYVANEYSLMTTGGSLSIIDGATNQLLTTLYLHAEANAVAVNPNTGRVYVAIRTNTINVVADPNLGFRVKNLPSGYNVWGTPNMVVDLAIAGNTSDVTAYLTGTGGSVARLALRFSQVDADIDFASNLTAAQDWDTGKAVLHRSGGFPSGVGQRDLLVPKLAGQTRVWVCPGAASLAQVNTSCSGGYYLSLGQTGPGQTRLSTTTIWGNAYWVVENVTGTGAMGDTPASPTATPPITPTASPLPAAGSGSKRLMDDPNTQLLSFIALGAVLAAVCWQWFCSEKGPKKGA